MSNDPNIPSWGWWVGRTNMNMRYWGGSSPGSGMCKCALKSECRNVEEACNCDAGPHCTQYLRVSDMIMCTVYSMYVRGPPDSAMRIKLLYVSFIVSLQVCRRTMCLTTAFYVTRSTCR